MSALQRKHRGINVLTVLLSHQAKFLGDSNFPQRAKEGTKGTHIRVWQALYEQYSTLILSDYADRPAAIAGLERRLCRALDTDGGFGAFERFFARSILWQKASTKTVSLLKIPFPPGRGLVPSWSWMAYQGAIEFPELPFAGVDWTRTEYSSPWSDMAAPNRSSETRRVREKKVQPLRVIPRNVLSTSVGVHSRIVWDVAPISGPLKCAVVGRLKEESGQPMQKHYVLIIKETHKQGTYERVGMGVLAKNEIDFGGTPPLSPVH